MAGRRAVACYKYAWGATVPQNMAPIAVVEVAEPDPVPQDMPHWDVTYYSPGVEAPNNLARYVAYGYAVGEAIPAMLRKVAAWVVAWGTLSGEGKLDFSKTVNSHHLATLVF